MSEQNGFATKDDLFSSCDNRRFASINVGSKPVRIRSINAGEYARVEALATKSAISARGNNTAKQVKALCDANSLLISLCVCDGEGNPVFNESDLPKLASLDSSVAQALASACMEHCGLDAAELETIAKNSAETS